MKKYVFNKYEEKFPELYRREKTKLKKILPRNVKIEHVGSTAILGLGGKGIIDILIASSKKDIQKIKKKLIKGGYEFKSKAGDKNRLFFEKNYKYQRKVRRVHAHVTIINSKVWKGTIAVKDYLKQNKRIAKKYEQIKKKAVHNAKGEGKKYQDYKKSFLDTIEKKALAK